MESPNFKEVNLFAESENEDETAKDIGRKRKRDFADKDLCELNAMYKKSVKKEKTEICKQGNHNLKEIDIKPKPKQDYKKPIESNLWSIEDTLFYPLGIRSHYIVGVNKSVLLIWSELSVINFVIKKNPSTKQTKTTRVRLYVPNFEQIQDIQVLEFNTLLLLESGRINYFSSSKSMHMLPWLDNVRCIAACPNGFSVIRLDKDKKLELQVYEDVVDMGKHQTGPLKYKYDITFDELNIFNCGWEDEHYYLLSTIVNESNLEFLKLVTRNNVNLDHRKEIHFFAISGNVFLLVPDIEATTYQIEMLFSYSSNVAVIKLDFERNFCFIFLQCGVIDMWYKSSKWQHLRHQTYSIGVEHTSFSYSESRAALYFTDEDQVAEFRFSKNQESDELVLHETYKAIPGILSCTWIEAIEQLVCLDCNNIFHQLSFGTLPIENYEANAKTQPVIKTAEFEKFNTLFELTPQSVAQLLKKANIIQELNELPKVLYNDIEHQFRKQELLAISQKRCYYTTLLSAHLQFSCGPLSTFGNDVIPLFTHKHFIFNQSSLLALIYVEIKRNEIFQTSRWQLHLQSEEMNHIFTLPKSGLQRKFCFVVPLAFRSGTLLPEFRLHLYTFVSCASKFVTIALPITIIINNDTFVHLFSFGKVSCTTSLKSQCSLEDLLKNFNKQSESICSTEIKCCIGVPICFKLNSIFKISETDALLFDENSFEISFLNSEISICYNSTDKIVILKSNDAAALLYIKIHLQLACEQHLGKSRTKIDDNQRLLRYQCNVERLYGILQGVDNDDLNEKPSLTQRIKSLRDIYLKMRKELFQSTFL